jgi:hypothetical protein
MKEVESLKDIKPYLLKVQNKLSCVVRILLTILTNFVKFLYRALNMWDPISLFYCMWILNIGMPDVRLNVVDIIKVREEKLISDTITKNVNVREGV